ncbi:hypothetical protein BgiBS90_000761, partial [Biomphalaria glabrata]
MFVHLSPPVFSWSNPVIDSSPKGTSYTWGPRAQETVRAMSEDACNDDRFTRDRYPVVLTHSP